MSLIDKIDEFIDEGRSSTPKYVVDWRIKDPKWSATSTAWKVKDYGKPTEANLAKYAKRYNESIKPGGVNDHLGSGQLVLWLGLRENSAGAPYIVEWGKK